MIRPTGDWHRIIRLRWGGIILLVLWSVAGCSPRTAASDSRENVESPASSDDAEPEDATTMSEHAVTLSCEVARKDQGEVIISVEAVNRGDKTVHLLDKARLPYLVREGEGVILALYGVNEPDPDIDYYGVQIPLTRPLPAGERFRDEFRLVPLVLHDHFARGTDETEVGDSLRLRCRLAYGLTPIDKVSRLQMSIKSLLEWQRWVEAPELQINLAE